MKKAFTLLGLIILVGFVGYMTFGDLVSGALSVKKLDANFYYMEFSGDDGFDDFLASGGAKDANQLGEKIMYFLSKGHYNPNAKPDTMKFGCSALSVRNIFTSANCAGSRIFRVARMPALSSTASILPSFID